MPIILLQKPFEVDDFFSVIDSIKKILVFNWQTAHKINGHPGTHSPFKNYTISEKSYMIYTFAGAPGILS
jgi:hypothetical protein